MIGMDFFLLINLSLLKVLQNFESYTAWLCVYIAIKKRGVPYKASLSTCDYGIFREVLNKTALDNSCVLYSCGCKD